MLIRVQELEVRKVEFHESFRPGVIEFGEGIDQQTPLQAAGHAELLEELHPRRHRVLDIRLVGDYSTRLQIRCARCLEPVEAEAAASFDLVYRPRGSEGRPEESAITQAETEIGFYSGDGVVLEEVLREQILLALPLRTVCREDCRGLCPRCGKNLNLEPCACPEPAADPRWEALRGLRDKLKQ